MSEKSGKLGIIAAIAKIGAKLFKPLVTGGKVLKVVLFGGSAISYTALFGWKVAVMILVLLLLHEGGHLWAMKHRGMKTKGMYFIPFLGAAAVPDESFPSREAENYVALMGPTVGLLLSVAAYGLYLATHDIEFVAAAGWMALVNLINLLPIMPLDGGRVLRSISFSFNSWSGFRIVVLGMIVGAIFLIKIGALLFIILMPLGFLEVASDYRMEKRNTRDIKIVEKAKEVFDRACAKIEEILAKIKRAEKFGPEERKAVDEMIIFLNKEKTNLAAEVTNGAYVFLPSLVLFFLEMNADEMERLLKETNQKPELAKESFASYEKDIYLEERGILKERVENDIKEYHTVPKMSNLQMLKGAAWAIGLTASLFLVIHFATLLTGGQYLEILK